MTICKFSEFKLEKDMIFTADRILNFIKSLNDPNIVYIKTDLIKNRNNLLVKQSNWRDFDITYDLSNVKILVTGHSDYDINETELDIINSSNLKLWLCQNKNYNHPKLLSIPIGLPNLEPGSEIHKIGGNLNKLYNASRVKKEIINLVYLNYSSWTYPLEREKVINLYSTKNWVTCEETIYSHEARDNFLHKVNNHKFVFATRGNGIDTHRLWESLYLRTIPIVKRCIGMEDFNDLPILFIENWEDITEDYLNEQYEIIMNKTYNLEKLDVNYWMNLIKNTYNNLNNIMINIYNPDIENYKKSALNAIEEGWISNHGKYIELANNKLKEITQAKYSILMANGTCTTHCLFLSLKFKYPNIDKIYVPNNCYVAAWNSALMEYNINQLEVMKMDIDTWNISTNEDYINSLDKNCAVLIVHNLGNIINVPNLKRIRPDLVFVEDNCEGMFGKYENIYSGMSDSSLCSSCSFYGNKIITTGEGGAFFTQDEEVYNYIKCIYSQGMSDIKYLHKLHAYNYRMTNVQAGFLFDQLNDIDNILTNKYKIFENYNELLKELVDLGKVQLMKIDEDTINAPWIYALRIINNDKTIEETTQFFKDNNIDIRPFFYPINNHTHLKSIKNDDKISYKLNKEIIMIPSSPNITYEEQKKVVDIIKNL